MDKEDLRRLKDEYDKLPREYIEYIENKHSLELSKHENDYIENVRELDRHILTIGSATTAFLLTYMQLQDKVLMWNIGKHFLLTLILLTISIFAVICSYIFAVRRGQFGIMLSGADKSTEELALLKELNDERALKLSNIMERYEKLVSKYDDKAQVCNVASQAFFLAGFLNTLVIITYSTYYLTNAGPSLDKVNSCLFFVLIAADFCILCMAGKMLGRKKLFSVIKD